jgi:alpha-glucosidase
MPLADAPDAQVQIGRFLDECQANRIPCSAFHFGSGYTSIGPRRYVFNWNREKFPDPKVGL